jgi:hypothetical protein
VTHFTYQNGVPTFEGEFQDAVTAWLAEDRKISSCKLRLGAIAASLERSRGGRRSDSSDWSPTSIQVFCRTVKIDRQTFQRLSHTYRVFTERVPIGGTCFQHADKLPFKHYEVAARLAENDPQAAIQAAVDNNWSAKRLEQELTWRGEREAEREHRLGQEEKRGREQKEKPFSFEEAYQQFKKFIDTWPSCARPKAASALRRLADEIDGFHHRPSFFEMRADEPAPAVEPKAAADSLLPLPEEAAAADRAAAEPEVEVEPAPAAAGPEAEADPLPQRVEELENPDPSDRIGLRDEEVA